MCQTGSLQPNYVIGIYPIFHTLQTKKFTKITDLGQAHISCWHMLNFKHTDVIAKIFRSCSNIHSDEWKAYKKG